ncbi:MAG: hypothetical protein KAI24_06200, partial [Planctomycetes bacterium]|nr:hypothetical protein [Planctomycetota bacterium]
EQHWASWLLATALHRKQDSDPEEVAQLCRDAIAWQQRHEQDRSRQVYLLATSLRRLGQPESAKRAARDYLMAPEDDADPRVLKLLLEIADG